MPTIISNSLLGFSNNALGKSGLLGAGKYGRTGEMVAVNARSGNLFLQSQDEFLAALGDDFTALRSYNSQGLLDDDNGDNWSHGYDRRQLQLSGTLNANGSVLTLTERDGARHQYQYDAAQGRYLSTDGDGAYNSLVFDTQRQSYIWRAADGQASREFDLDGRLSASLDHAGNRTNYIYEGDLLLRVEDASGGSVHFDYDGRNLRSIRTSATVDGRQQTQTRVRYAYDSKNRLSKVTVDLSPEDNSIDDNNIYVTEYGYDGDSERIESIKQSDGTSLLIRYELIGEQMRVRSITDGLQQTTQFAYDLVNHTTTITDALQFTTILEHDALSGRLKSVQTQAAVSEIKLGWQKTSYEYNARGDLQKVIAPDNRITQYEYDVNGNQVLQYDNAGNTITRTYDAANRLQTESIKANDGGNLTTQYVRDAQGRLRFVVSPAGRLTEHRYDEFGQHVAQLQYEQLVGADILISEASLQGWVAHWLALPDSQARRTDYAYDERGLLASSTVYAELDVTGEGIFGEEASHTTYVYDQFGRLLQSIAAEQQESGQASIYAYDGLGRQIASTNALQHTTTTVYDDANRKVTFISANGLRTVSYYDQAGRLVSLEQIEQTEQGQKVLGQAQYLYDAQHRLIMRQDALGVKHWYFYDPAGRKIAEVDAKGGITAYVYDARGQLLRSIAYNTALTADKLQYLQDNPLSAVWGSDGANGIKPLPSAVDRVTRRIYDVAGRLLKIIDAAGALTSYEYDHAGRLLRLTQSAKLLSLTNLRALAAQEAAGKLILPSDKNTQVLADAVYDRVTRYFYDADGLRTGQLDAEGYLSQYQYNAMGQLVLTHRYATVTAADKRTNGSLAELIPAYAAQDQRSVQLYNAKGQLAASIDAENYLTRFWYDRNGNQSRVQRFANRVVGVVQSNTALDAAQLQVETSIHDQTSSYHYDALNRLESSVDAQGTPTAYRYDTQGNLLSQISGVRDPQEGGVRGIERRYDIQGRLIAELSGEGSRLLHANAEISAEEIEAIWAEYSVRHTYDKLGRRTSSTDQRGNSTLFYYDRLGNLQYRINPEGEVVETTYNVYGQVASTITHGVRVEKAYLATLLDNTKDLSQVRIAPEIKGASNGVQNSVQSYEYDQRGLLKIHTDELNVKTGQNYTAFGELLERHYQGADKRRLIDRMDYDRRGLLKSQRQDIQGVNLLNRQQSYDAFGRLSETLDANGNLWRKEYDKLGRMVVVVAPEANNPEGQRSITTYDAFARILTQTDALNQTTSYTYDPLERSMTVTSAEGVAMTTYHDRHGQRVKIKDGLGNQTEFHYDGNGKLLRTIDALGTTENIYDAAGLLVEAKDGRGNRTKYEYDAANRVLHQTIDPDNNNIDPPHIGLKLRTSFVYDAKGRLFRQTDARGIVNETQYDNKGQIKTTIQDIHGLKITTSYQFDAEGRILSLKSPNGQLSTVYEYDSLGRLKSKTERGTDGYLAVNSYQYDNNNNLIAQTDANQHLTRHLYDAQNRRIGTLDAEGGYVSLRYDAAGNLSQRIHYAKPIHIAATDNLDALADPARAAALISGSEADQITHYFYDQDRRLRYSVEADGSVQEREYDANNNVWRSTRHGIKLPLEQIQTTQAIQEWIGNAEVNTKQVSVRSFDARNRMVFEIDGRGALTEYQYDANGNLYQRIGYTHLFETFSNVSAPPEPASVQAMIQAQLETLDGDSYRRQMAQEQHQLMRYDAANRLTSIATLQNFTSTYENAQAVWRIENRSLDANGNVVALDNLQAELQDGSAWQGLWRVTDQEAQDSIAIFTERARFFAYPHPQAKSHQHSRMVYDSANRLIASATAQGRNSSGQMQWAVVRNTLDKMGNVTLRTAYANALLGAGEPVAYAGEVAQASWINSVTKNAKADRVSRAFYDSANRLSFDINAVGAVTQYSYAANGELQQKIAYAQAVSSSLSKLSDIQASLTPEGRQWADHAQWVNDGQNRLTSYWRDGRGQITHEMDSLGQVSSYQYNSQGLLIQKKVYAQALNGSQHTQRPTSETLQTLLQPSAADRRDLYFYDGTGRERYHLNPENYLTQSDYDALGRLKQSTAYEQRVGNLQPEQSLQDIQQQVAGQSSVSTHYRYDIVGNQTSKIIERSSDSVEMSHGESYRHDAFGNRIAYTNSLGVTWKYQYDNGGRMAYEIGPQTDAKQIRLQYDAASNSTTQQVEERRASLVKEMQRDAFGNLTRLNEIMRSYGEAHPDTGVRQYSDSHLRQTDYEYNAQGRLSKTILPLVHAATGRASLILGSEGNNILPTGWIRPTNSQTYNVFGEVIVEEDVGGEYQTANGSGKTKNGNFSYTSYDAMGRIRFEVDAAGFVTEYERNAFGDVLRLTRHAYNSALPEQAVAAMQVHALLFGRAASLNNLQHYAEKLAAGESVASLANSLMQAAPQQYPANLSHSNFVRKLYQNGLQRSAGADEMQHWLTYLQTHTRAEAAQQFISMLQDAQSTDAEVFKTSVANMLAPYSIAQSNPAPPHALTVLRVSALLLNKTPSKTSLAEWGQQISAGKNLDEIAQAIMQSASADYPAEMDATALIQKLYATGTGRAASQEEVAHWLARLQDMQSQPTPHAPQSARGQLIVEMSELLNDAIDNPDSSDSRYFRAKVDAWYAPYTATLAHAEPGSVAVLQVYGALLGRGVDRANLQKMAYALSSGKLSQLEIAQNLISSQRSQFPAEMSDVDFIHKVYKNLLNREASADELRFWGRNIQENRAGRAGMVVDLLQAANAGIGQDNDDARAYSNKLKAWQAPFSLTQTGLSSAAIEAVLAQHSDPSKNRSIAYQYDRLGREIRKTEPTTAIHDPGYLLPGAVLAADGSLQAARTTTTTYDRFGNIQQTSVFAADANGQALTRARNTYYAYDHLSRKTAQVEVHDWRDGQEQGYLSTWEYDVAGYLVSHKEYARQMALDANVLANLLSQQNKPEADPENDRETRYTYTGAGELTSETQVNVAFASQETALADMTSARGDITSYYYRITDAQGRTIQVKQDSLQRTTYTLLDGRGEAIGILSTVTGVGVLEEGKYISIERDIYGRVVRSTEHAEKGMFLWEGMHWHLPQANAEDDRITIYAYDNLNNETQKLNAEGQLLRTTRDVFGRMVMQSQWVTNQYFGTKEELLEITEYDALGNVINSAKRELDQRLPKDIAAGTGKEPGFAHQRSTYNSFGEITQQSLVITDARSGARLSEQILARHVYDNGGNVVATQLDDGVMQTLRYNLAGQLTLRQRSDGQGEIIREETRYNLVAYMLQQGNTQGHAYAQTFDRWGNVLTRSDARDGRWLTRYAYNANNQVIQVSLPIVTSLETPGQIGAATSRYVYDAAGRLILHLDAKQHWVKMAYDAYDNQTSESYEAGGATIRHYNLFGNLKQQIRQMDAHTAIQTEYAYNRLGLLTQVSSAAVDVHVLDRDTISGQLSLHSLGQQVLVDAYVYDELGRRIQTSNGAEETTAMQYDLAGNVITTRNAQGQESHARYDQFGHKIAEQDANGKTKTARYSASGQLQQQTDMSGAITYYQYDQAGQLRVQYNSGAMLTQHKIYSYRGGLLRDIEDRGTGQRHHYDYDAAGNRIVEQTWIKSGQANEQLIQNNLIALDAQNRILKIEDGNFTVSHTYDDNGNRVITRTRYRDNRGNMITQTAYNAYDSRNRAILLNAAGYREDGQAIYNEYSHAITYDWAGNRTSDTFLGKKIIRSTNNGNGGIGGNGSPSNDFYDLDQTSATTTESYRYDAAGRLTEVWRDEVLQVDGRKYDAAGRLIRSGAVGVVEKDSDPDGESTTNRGQAFEWAGVVAQEQWNLYENGQQTRQKTRYLTGADASDIYYQDGMTGGGYDAVGNLMGYTIVYGDGARTTYRFTYEAADSYRQVYATAANSNDKHSRTISEYDANGNLWRVTDHTDDKVHMKREFAYDEGGRVLQKAEFDKGAINATSGTRSLIVNGEMLGTDAHNAVGELANPYTAISMSHGNNAPSVYTVRDSSETLQSIARTVWGDSKLWYIIAEANALSDGQALQEGQILKLPTRINTINNDAHTYQPYDATKLIGGTTPPIGTPINLPCGGKGDIIAAIVAVVVTVVVNNHMGPWAAAKAAEGAWMALAANATVAATAAAAGNLAQQVVLNAAEMQDGIRFRDVALAGIGGAVGQLLPTRNIPVIHAMATNLATQVIGKITHLQKEPFRWRNVAAAGVGDLFAGIGGSVGGSVGAHIARALGNKLVQKDRISWRQTAIQAVSGMVGDAATYALAGQKQNGQNPPPVGQVLNEPAAETARLQRYQREAEDMAEHMRIKQKWATSEGANGVEGESAYDFAPNGKASYDSPNTDSLLFPTASALNAMSKVKPKQNPGYPRGAPPTVLQEAEGIPPAESQQSFGSFLQGMINDIKYIITGKSPESVTPLSQPAYKNQELTPE